MAYAKNGCPASHPVPLPAITYKIAYLSPGARTARRWRLASDMYPASKPAGYSNHADFVNGWKPDVQRTFVSHCVNAGLVCHGNLLGDGRTLY